jgi:LysR family transcriptional regulator, glycine cleavage system transcriptional activator
MSRLVHLNGLHALEAALRHGTLTLAASELGISPAAIGQRVRALEEYLEAPLLERGAGGVRPTALADRASAELTEAFARLRAVADMLNLDRQAFVRLRADPDWVELWLNPRLDRLGAASPSVRLTVQTEAARGVQSDVTVAFTGDADAEELYPDFMVPVASPDLERRLRGRNAASRMEGIPLLHLDGVPGSNEEYGWADWIARFGGRSAGLERGIHYRSVALALRAVDADAGILLCPLSLALPRFAGRSGTPRSIQAIAARNGYRMKVGPEASKRRNVQGFVAWLRAEAAATRSDLADLTRS